MRRQERIKDWASKLNAVPVVWFEAIRQFKARNDGRPPPMKALNKIGTLAAFRIDPSGSKLPIDYSWYRYGTVAERLPPEVVRFVEPKTGSPCADWVGGRPDLSPDDPLAERVKNEVSKVIADYPKPEDFERMVDEVYDFAPFQFQGAFRLARMRLGLTGYGSKYEKSVKDRDFWGLFYEAMETFPEQDFPQVAICSGPLRELVKLTWNRLPERDHSPTRAIVEGFWETFCAHLRTHPQGHTKGLSRDLIGSRAAEASWSLERLRDQIGDLALGLSEIAPEIVEDATLGPYLERRKRELDEQTTALQEGLQDADEIKRIIAQGD